MTGRAFLDLRARDCHYPLGERDEPPTTFCGEPALPGRPYCACHHRIAYTSPRRAQPEDRQTPAAMPETAPARSVTHAR